MAKIEKVTASSLVEVTVAMVILVLLLALSFTVVLRVVSYGHKSKILKYDMLASKHAFEVKQEKRFFDEEIKFEEVKITQQIAKYKAKVLILEINITDSAGDTLSNYKELIYHDMP